MKLEAYAKVNLTLEVLGERSDGYHALRSVVLPVSLSDTLDVEVTADGTIASDTGYDDDLCVKAARALKCVATAPSPSLCGHDGEGAVVTQKGAVIRVVKRIPAGGGLGGGSADAAAVLRALNELWGIGLSREALAEVGARVGSDVPALVLGGPVLMEGRGERVSPLSVSDFRFHLVLANPGVFSSTAAVYARCRPRAAGGPSPTDAMVKALAGGDPAEIAAALANDLQAPACALHPEIADAMDALREAGAVGVLMSGSGSTVFGLARSEGEARRISAAMTGRGLAAWAVRPCCRVADLPQFADCKASFSAPFI